jgi:CRISPR system Cascade subunit CasA
VVERRPTGLLDWLTWPCRRIRLHANGSDGTPVIDGVLIMKGDQLKPGDYEADFEQMVAYRLAPDAKAPQSPFPPIGFERDRAVWRDSSALLQSVAPEGKRRGQRRPKTLDALAGRALDEDDPDPTNALPLDLFGINLDQFNVLFWRHERLPVPPAYLKDPRLYEGLQNALGLAEASGRTLNSAARRLAELLLSPDPNRGADPKATAAFATSMGAGRRYWSRLGDHFTQFLFDQQAEGTRALRDWAHEVRRAARAAFDEVADGQAAEGWSLKARVEAERTLNFGLAEARKKHVGDVEEVAHAIA